MIRNEFYHDCFPQFYWYFLESYYLVHTQTVTVDLLLLVDLFSDCLEDFFVKHIIGDCFLIFYLLGWVIKTRHVKQNKLSSRCHISPINKSFLYKQRRYNYGLIFAIYLTKIAIELYFQILKYLNNDSHCVKTVQIRTRKYSVFGHFSHSVKKHLLLIYFEICETKVIDKMGLLLYFYYRFLQEPKKHPYRVKTLHYFCLAALPHFSLLFHIYTH